MPDAAAAAPVEVNNVGLRALRHIFPRRTVAGRRLSISSPHTQTTHVASPHGHPTVNISIALLLLENAAAIFDPVRLLFHALIHFNQITRDTKYVAVFSSTLLQQLKQFPRVKKNKIFT